MKIIVTGGAGFIGSALVRQLIQNTEHQVLNIDKLNYAANLQSLHEIEQHPRYRFAQMDICQSPAIQQLISEYQPDAIIHLAAESHVDRSITDPNLFVTSNIVGTQVLLEASRQYWKSLDTEQQRDFRFLYVSTDEVYGSRVASETVDETAAYRPNSPYAASKAAATHLVRAYGRTYRLPVISTYSSNNYGPWQYPEKLIPLSIRNALSWQPITVYGSGQQQRNWLYVNDHVDALLLILQQGEIGANYNIGGDNEISNLELVQLICRQLDQLAPAASGNPYQELISFVADRPAHDLRYGIDDTKLRQQLGWSPKFSFEHGIQHTINWYLTHFKGP